MTLRNDTRGVSEVVGAILVFGVLIALLAVMQTQAVPAANQQVEFEHSQDVQGDFAEFHAAANDVATGGDRESVSIAAGTGYPTRMLFFNPPRVQGSISTSENRTVTIQNAQAVDPEVDDYLNGDDVSLGSRTLRYDVSYNELGNPPQVRYEYGILYNQFRGDTTIQNPGSVIDDTEINLVFMAGNYSRTAGDTQSLEVRPVSAPSRPVTVEGKDGNNITMVLPTELPVEDWQELYGDQDHVTITDATGDNIKIELDGDRRYTLKMAGLGLEQGVDKPDAHYIVPAKEGVTDVGAGGNVSVAFEVRDRYNNPVAGENVSITLGGNTKFVDTNGEGKAAISVSPSTTGTATGKIVDCTGSDRCTADFNVNVISPGGSINPSGGVRLQEAVLATSIENDLGNAIGGLNPWTPGNNEGDAVDLVFSVDDNLEFDGVRVNYYASSDDSAPPEEWAMTDGSSTISGEISGKFNSSSSLDPSADLQVAFTDGSGSVVSASTSDYFVITVILSNGEQSIYFASPRTN
ncbi:Ig-like domain-containing protein [Natronomonas amylolytica]|uniref:Ig-like domain-containing protein n=1 Tax=Natronomonas amylolytica TaxID=3108498 RepID=UPI0030093C27